MTLHRQPTRDQTFLSPIHSQKPQEIVTLTSFFITHSGLNQDIMSAAVSEPAGQKTRPVKPDEDAYKANLAKAEKEHTAAQEKLVRADRPLSLSTVVC